MAKQQNRKKKTFQFAWKDKAGSIKQTNDSNLFLYKT